MTLDELCTELKKGKARTGYLVVGEETLLRDDAVAAIQKAILGDGPSDFDFDKLDGVATSPAALLNAVGALPVLAERRLVVLQEPDAGRAKSRGLTDAVMEALEGLASARDTVLVVVAAKVDGRARWVKAFGSAATVRCELPRGGKAVSAFVKAEAKRQGVKLDAAAAALLVERTGPQLLMLRREISKAGLFVAAGETVKAEHVAASTTDVAEEPIWDLTDAIGEGRCGDALALLGKLLRTGSAPPAILGAFANHFRKLTQMRCGGSVPGPPFALRKLESQSRRFSAARLVACIRAIHQTDLALKGAGGISPVLAMERLVIGLAR